MNKTLLKKFTATTFTYGGHAHAIADSEVRLAELMHDMKEYLNDAAHDLLQPRSEAVNRILELGMIRN